MLKNACFLFLLISWEFVSTRTTAVSPHVGPDSEALEGHVDPTHVAAKAHQSLATFFAKVMSWSRFFSWKIILRIPTVLDSHRKANIEENLPIIYI